MDVQSFESELRRFLKLIRKPSNVNVQAFSKLGKYMYPMICLNRKIITCMLITRFDKRKILKLVWKPLLFCFCFLIVSSIAKL